MDRRVRKTKQILRAALTQLLLQKNIQEISVRELTDLADINRGTFYLHYRDIYDLLHQIENEMFQEFNSAIEQYLPELRHANSLPVLEATFRFLCDYADMCRALLGKNGDPAFVDRLKQVVWDNCFHHEPAMSEVRLTPEEHEMLHAFIAGGCIGIFECWLKNGMNERPGEMALLAQRLIEGAIKIV